MRLDVSESADNDLARIYQYTLERWGYSQASQYIDAIYAGFDILCKNPEIGMYHPILTKVRKFPFREHMVFYRVQDDRLRVIRVLHKSADLKRAFLV